jgi:hypothetical protein
VQLVSFRQRAHNLLQQLLTEDGFNRHVEEEKEKEEEDKQIILLVIDTINVFDKK